MIKLLVYTSEEHLPGIVSMGTQGYIPDVLNKAAAPSPAKYAAAASDYFPRPGRDNGFLTGPFATRIMEEVFKHGGNEVANDLIVPRDGVFANNDHPSFPIVDPLLYSRDSGVWHSGFFAHATTIAHIEDKLMQLGSGVNNAHSTNGDIGALDVVGELRRTVEAPNRHLRGGLSGLPPIATAPQPRLNIERKPEIDFHESIMEGQPEDLRVHLLDVSNEVNRSDIFSLDFAAGEDRIPITVELSAPGFTVRGSRTATMTICRKRNPETEEVHFTLVAGSPGEKPVVRKIIASFFRDGDCVGAVTHCTEVVPIGCSSISPAGQSTFDQLKIGPRRREDVDLIIYVREDTARADVFEVAVRSNIIGEEYGLRDMGILKLAGTEFSHFFSQTIDPKFGSFPNDPALTDEQFDAAVALGA